MLYTNFYMDQRQFKIGMSVSAKLLVTISILLAIPIFFINISAISLFRNDKKAYIYDGQATAAFLTGREFVSYISGALNTLKLVIGTADLSNPLTEQAKASMQFYLENQHALIGLDLWSYDRATKQLTLAHENFLSTSLKELEISADALRLAADTVSSQITELGERSFRFLNISRDGQPPVLAVVYADLAHAPPTTLATVAVGFVSLSHFLANSPLLNRFIIADKDGTLLFHSDLKTLASGYNMTQDGAFREALAKSEVTGSKEYFTSKGVRTLGSYYKPGLDLIAITQIDYDEAMKAAYTLTEKFAILGLASLGIMIVMGIIFSRRLTAPLNRLFQATAQVSAGDFKINLPVSSRDEIGALTASFVAMSRKISDLIQETADKVRVDQELEIVKAVQQSLFPPSRIENEHALVYSHYESAAACGGDWFGYFRSGEKHTFVIADATGHGLSSALMTASARGCFSVIEKLVADARFELDPNEMLSVANRVVYDSAQGKIMMTAFVCILDFSTHMITFASAAHNPPWLFRKTQEGYRQMSLVARGRRLGEVQEAAEPFDVQQMPFEKSDTLFFYTDGLLEGKNKEGHSYGKKQVRRVIEDALDHDSKTLIATVISDFMGHNAGKKLDDDVTLAVVRTLA